MRIVLLQALGLGDFLTALPAIRAVRRHFSGDHLTWMGNVEYPELVEPLFDDVLPQQSLANAPKLAFDLGINLHGSGPRSHEVLSACTRQIAFFDPVLAPNGPRWSPSIHIRSLWTGLVHHFGIAADAQDMFLSGPTSREEVLIHVGAKDHDRWWPEERFRELLSYLPNAIVVAGASDKERARAISTDARLPSLKELAELVATSSLVIGVDSGVAHLAYAFKRPTVTLFGPAPASRWGPPPHPRHQILGNLSSIEAIHPDGPCSPHLLDITVADVRTAVEKVLSLV